MAPTHPTRSPLNTFYLDGMSFCARRPRRRRSTRWKSAAADLHGLARTLLPARHGGRHALPDLPPGGGPRRRRGPDPRRPERHAAAPAPRSSAPSARCACGPTSSRSRSRPSRRTSPASSATALVAVCRQSGWIEIGGAGMVDPTSSSSSATTPRRCRDSRSGWGSNGWPCCGTGCPTSASLGERPAVPGAVLRSPRLLASGVRRLDVPPEEMAA